ncbi:aldo-keto reductase [Flavobacterium sp. 9R]|uniref:L-glyceraldehyde 3-phosphate reductase n=1 Tax=Flavobacterium sp. 9R TaxID=2653143 RepID=UPI0012F08F70|nr:L-glyceraldehyde 3-phosphate reductase [Flavobacterium sp. 9R]VXC06228.1 aldo-keto reductase [Flavobacterium sp. 9R]
MKYQPNTNRYNEMVYRRTGNSGLLLPAISLGLWHNFGNVDVYSNYESIVLNAFDKGITHFDLANNYGPPPGSAESNFGKILHSQLSSYRDELIISSKAGYDMWPGPYGEWGSRKYMIASIEQSLKRMNLDYVDIFYSHRFDPLTPLEETMGALAQIVRQGKALYVGISNYPAAATREAIAILKDLGTPCLIHQPKYSMFERWVEEELITVLGDNGVGCIAFSPLAQGLLTNKYLRGIPENSRASKQHGALQSDAITPEILKTIGQLNTIALERGQSLAQMAIAWLLKDNRVTSVLIGASSVTQLNDNLASLANYSFTDEEITMIEKVLKP